MKRTFFSALFIVFAFTINAQFFSTSLYFEDKDGNRDTLIIGMDSTATYKVDSLWEVEYSTEEMLAITESGKHWVWGIIRNYYPDLKIIINTFLRTQIVPPTPKNSWTEDALFYMVVPPERLPVTVKWDKTAFSIPEVQKSIITDYVCGFDVFSDYMCITPRTFCHLTIV